MTLALAPVVSRNQKSHVAPHLDCLDLRNAKVWLIMPSASNYAKARASCITLWQCWCQWDHMTEEVMQWCHFQHYWCDVTLTVALMVLHDQKCHVAPHFNNLDVWNAVVLLTMPMVSLDAKASASVMAWSKRSCLISLQSSWCKECNGGHWWHCCCHQWHHMTKKVMLHLILIISTIGMQWCHWWCYQHHMMLTLSPMASHDQKSHVTPHFSYLDLKNAMVALIALASLCVMMPLPMMSHD